MLINLHQRIPISFKIVIGALVGVILLHPLVTLIFWLEFNQLLSTPSDTAADFLWWRIRESTSFEMFPMNLLFAGLGAGLALVLDLVETLSEKSREKSHILKRQLSDQLPMLIAAGESETTEFKESLRWDVKEGRVNKKLEKVIAKSLAGFMNHRGGNLLIGLSDDGTIKGIELDCKTLRSKSQDGFERALIDLVNNQLGANAATMVHIQFLDYGGHTICWVIVDSAFEPVYLKDGNISRYFVRLGNSTRELDVREAQDHIAQSSPVGNS